MIVALISTALGSGVLSSFFTYLAGRKSRRVAYREELATALESVQKTVDLLADKNTELWHEVVELRAQNAALSSSVDEVLRELEGLRLQYEAETGKQAPGLKRSRKMAANVNVKAHKETQNEQRNKEQ